MDVSFSLRPILTQSYSCCAPSFPPMPGRGGFKSTGTRSVQWEACRCAVLSRTLPFRKATEPPRLLCLFLSRGHGEVEDSCTRNSSVNETLQGDLRYEGYTTGFGPLPNPYSLIPTAAKSTHPCMLRSLQPHITGATTWLTNSSTYAKRDPLRAQSGIEDGETFPHRHTMMQRP